MPDDRSMVHLALAEDEAGMASAVRLAQQALSLGELPVGAVVISNGRTIARAHAQQVTQRRSLAHAELLALDEADKDPHWDRRGATLYSTLEPCLMCLGAAATASVGRVVYALDTDGDAVSCLAAGRAHRRSPDLPLLHLPAIVRGIGAVDAAALFQTYVDERADSMDPFVIWAQAIIDRSGLGQPLRR